MVDEDRQLADWLGLAWANSEIADWDLTEANPYRLREFTEFYRNKKLSGRQKRLLMELIFASFEEAVDKELVLKSTFGRELTELIVPEFELHRQMLEYWASTDFHEFNIASVARAILKAGERARGSSDSD